MGQAETLQDSRVQTPGLIRVGRGGRAPASVLGTGEQQPAGCRGWWRAAGARRAGSRGEHRDREFSGPGRIPTPNVPPGEPPCPALCHGDGTALALLFTSVNGRVGRPRPRLLLGHHRPPLSPPRGLLPGRRKRRKAHLGLGRDAEGRAGGTLLPPGSALPGSHRLSGAGAAHRDPNPHVQGQEGRCGPCGSLHFPPRATEGGSGRTRHRLPAQAVLGRGHAG